MIEVRQPWWRLCLRSPFYGELVPLVLAGGLFVTLACVLAGVWIAVPIAVAAFVVLEASSARMRFRADGSGILVRNRFSTHRIQWADVRWFGVFDRWQRFGGVPNSGDVLPVLLIGRRDAPAVTVFAAIGMRRAELEELARQLDGLARENGAEIDPAAEAAGSREGVA